YPAINTRPAPILCWSSARQRLPDLRPVIACRLTPRAPAPALLPYTTLFRSASAKTTGATIIANFEIAEYYAAKGLKTHGMNPGRSEEHTSELQSREKLVCRPLLEKQNA